MISLFLIHGGGIVFLREYKDDIKKTQRLQLSFESMLTNEMTACFRITEQDSAKCRRGKSARLAYRGRLCGLGLK